MTGQPWNVDAMHKIAALLRSWGWTVLEMDGWQDRGRPGYELRAQFVGAHHTAAAVDVDRILRDGRPDVAGPLCLEGGATVLTARGLVAIADVVVGDEVWTHRQRWRPVTGVMRRKAPTVRVRAPGMDVLCTDDHRWLDGAGKWRPARDGSSVVHADRINTSLPLPDVDGFSATAELLRVAGAWVADGHVIKRSLKSGEDRSSLGFSIRQAKAPTVKKWLTAAGLDWWQSVERDGIVGLRVRSTALAHWMVEHFGRLAHGKRVPAWLLGHPEHASAFLDGYLHGDGQALPHTDRHRPYRRASTVSRSLAVGVVLLARSLGGWAYIAQRRAGRSLSINGRATQGREYWVVDVYDDPPQHPQQYHRDAHGLAADVTTVSPAAVEQVYDITVAEDHSMLIDGVWSHNCNFAVHLNGDLVLVAAGKANHFGVASIDSTRAWGIEATGPVPTGAKGLAAFPNYQAYRALVVAIRVVEGWPVDRIKAHKEVALPDGRKPDPAFEEGRTGDGYPAPYPEMDRFRAACNVTEVRRTAPVPEETFMALNETEERELLTRVRHIDDMLGTGNVVGKLNALQDDEGKASAALAALRTELTNLIRAQQAGDLAAEEVADKVVDVIGQRIAAGQTPTA